MNRDHIEHLRWLPLPPADFRAQIRLVDATDAPGRQLQRLAAHALGISQLERLADKIDRLRDEGRDLAPLTCFRLGLIGNGTLDFLVPALIVSAARHGIVLECVRGAYDQVLQEALDPFSAINAGKLDAVLVAVDYRALPLRECPGDPVAAAESVAATLDQLAMIRGALETNGGTTVILQTLVPPVESLFGNLDGMVPGSVQSLVAQINAGLLATSATRKEIILDVASLASTLGIAEWHSPAQWNMAKLPFADRFIPIYAEHVARILAAMRGKSRRCLILDLDNTVWGGIVGDDGLEGIKTAEGDTEGEAHLAVQRLAIALRSRGVVLAVSSKNEDVTARLPFREHPEMLLRENHITVFQANWNDKATNITAIAKELSLGLDAMVFLDDNPAERALVRQTLPDVAVPELPDDPAMYARVLGTAGYFEALAFSDDDMKRAQFYEGNARRVALQAQVADLDAYLASLDMQIVFEPFDKVGRARIAQLINKSNQFNLTTRRYSEAEVAATEVDPRAFTLQVRLADAVGDNGMICVIVCREASPCVWDVDTWLMSCRVLGRRVEQMVLREIIHHAREHGIDRLIGRFLPTGRNMMVRDHYAKLGFTMVDEAADGATTWSLDLPFETDAAPMTVTRKGFEMVLA
ncbi:HAD-IIIC family phosphatase [Sphingomonas bacterium]|uniref:HAD-IIIC family phosphatase n=1 Tax=Sphingomonas bacterium TaxID=1895847 RepID=UPI001577199D|nr:HAD-IIIC family phosphatase [Sphingomonas bacterium]